MVKVINPLFSDAASGVFHRTFAYRNGENTQSVAKLPQKINTISAAQAAHRLTYKDFCDDWNQLSDTWQARWSLGAPAPLNGFSWFMKCQLLGITNPIGYKYKLELTLDNTNVDSDLDHFPVCLHLSASCGQGAYDATDIFDKLGENKLKIAVTDDSHVTQLYVEVEYWDSVAEIAILWFSSAEFTLLTATDTECFLFYDPGVDDNTDYVGTPGNAPNVWPASFWGRWGMAQDPSGAAPQMKDSTAGENDLTSVGSMASGDLILTDHGPAIEFDGGNDTLWCSHSDFTAYPVTMHLFIKVDAASAWAPYMGIQASANNNHNLCIFDNGGFKAVCLLFHVTNPNFSETTAHSPGDYVDIVVKYLPGSVQKMYIDGIYDAGGTSALTIPNGLDRLSLGGRYSAGPLYLACTIVEASAYEIDLDADWIKAAAQTRIDNLIELSS